MNDTTITIQIEVETLKALRLLADLHDSTIEACAGRYLKLAALEAEKNFEAVIKEADDAIERGEFLTHDEFKAWAAKQRAEVLLEIEQSKAA